MTVVKRKVLSLGGGIPVIISINVSSITTVDLEVSAFSFH